jgi:dTDP-4-amino-4,6-dideoxygalactose transaminase
LALDLLRGSEILVPIFTFYASASTAAFAGLRPVLVDADAAKAYGVAYRGRHAGTWVMSV